MLLQVLAIIAPVFVIIAVGYLAVLSGYMAREATGGLGLFVLRVALPALVFNALTSTPIGAALTWGYLLGYGGASLAVFGLGYFIARRIARQPIPASAVRALGISGSNTGFMGYPIAAMVIGAPAGQLLAQNMIFENLILIPFAFVLAELGESSATSLRAVLRGIVLSLARNPLLIAIAAGVAVGVAGIELPQPVTRPIALLASVAGPIALFVVGATLAELSWGGTPVEITRIVVGKLLLHPAAVAAALWMMPDLDPTLIAGGIIFAAAPMMSIYPIIGARFGIPRLTATALLAATALSAVTLSVLILVLGHFGLVTLGS